MSETRRSFLRWAIHGLGTVLAAIVGVPAVLYLISARHRQAPQLTFRPVDGLRLSELKDHEPRQGVIYDVRRDAWTLHPNDVVGRVWVVKTGPGNNDLQVFTTICPHLGCSVNLSEPANGFTCPCHGAEFQFDGSLVSREGYQNPSPRDMDTLEWRRDPANPDQLQVKYQDFVQGTHDKIAKA